MIAEKVSDLPPKLQEKVKATIKKYRLTSSQKNKAIKRILETYNRSTLEPGEAEGMVAAQSISEPATQMTMRTYHVAGAAQIEVTLGLPRLVEVFDARRSPKTPTMTIYLKRAYNTKDKAYKVAAEIREVTLKDITETAAVDLLNQQVEVVIDRSAARSSNLRPDKIFRTMKESLKNVDIRQRKDGFSVRPKGEYTIKDLQKLKTKALKTHLNGVKGVLQTVVSQTDEGWVINTVGSNLAKAILINGVDENRIMSNNIHEVQKVLGIEAARASIINEAFSTLEQQGLEVDIRHIMLVADMMTATGTIKAIGRYGIAGAKGSVLARANFEETIKHLTRAAIRGEEDNLESIVENVMINQVVPAGTGMFDLTFRLPKKK